MFCGSDGQNADADALAKKYKSSAVAEMGDRLATINMGQKVGGLLCPFLSGELGPHLTLCRLG